MVKLFSEFRKEMYEDVAVNSVGGGHIAGVGVGARGEPGIRKKTGSKMLRRKKPMGIVGESSGFGVFAEDKEDGELTLSIPVFIRSLEIAREKLKSDNDLHVFVERLMDVSSGDCLTMEDVVKVFEKYND